MMMMTKYQLKSLAFIPPLQTAQFLHCRCFRRGLYFFFSTLFWFVYSFYVVIVVIRL